MKRRLLENLGLPIAVSAALAAAFASACTTDYQKGLDDVLYGPPNALSNTKTPGGSTDFFTEDGGVATTPGSGPSVLCVKNGGALADGGACAVSFKTDVLAILGTAGCASSSDCHGGANPKYQPRIEPSDGPTTWATLAAFQLSDGKPYINPCSKDKAQAALACNLSATGTCGTKMPLGGGQVSPADVTKIEAWLACGSPNN
jgi:hypothetical protein